MSKALRVLYAAGPGDVIGTYGHWVEGHDDPSQVAITYSSQFYEVCRALNAKAYVIASHADKKLLRDGQFLIEHRPIPLRSSSGILYHLGQLWYGLRLIVSAVRFRSNVAVVADGTTHWFVLSILPWLGVQVIPSLHCVLWRKYIPQRRVEKILLNLGSDVFANRCTAILTASNEITEQLKQLTASENLPLVHFFPTYQRTEFVAVGEPDEEHSLFRVLFAGRIEYAKGVFDLLEIAKRFVALGRQDIRFDICGDGSALEALRQSVKTAGLESYFVCHGHCNKTQMREMFNRSHAVIVPTRTDFVEGFNQVVVEGILSKRPVVASAVCPALSYVGPAVVEVPPDDWTAYGDALLKLCDDRKFYKQKQQGCLGVQEQFYDKSLGWAAALKSVLVVVQENTELRKTLEEGTESKPA
jgi:glycosyltransferase involved in cell wall biosynthesis